MIDAMRNVRLAIRIIGLIVCLLFVGCASAPALVSNNPDIQVRTDGLPAPPAIKNYDAISQYRIGPTDLLTVSIYDLKDFSQDVRVEADGNIPLPLIGSVRAAGRTVMELQKDIAAKLSSTYLQNPQVSVFIKEYTSQHVTVEGIVKKPGVFPLMGPSSLLQVIANAQGLDDLADHKGVVVFRVIDGKKMAAVFDIDAIGRGAVDDPPIYGDDIVVVALSGSKDRLRTIIKAAPSIGLFHLLFFS
jgi:polysaccharide export outer membrane protein